MNSEFFLIFVHALTLVALSLAFLFAVGVVWRVEMELDISYKLFAFALVFLIMAEATNLFHFSEYSVIVAVVIEGSRMIASVLFLAGILFMRDIVRHLDGETDQTEKTLKH
jgi:hypothetical protein